MQVIHQNEDKRGSSRRTDLMDSLICTEEIGRCLKEEYTGGLERRFTGI